MRQKHLRDRRLEHGDVAERPDVFATEILPGLQTVPISRLVRATGLTHGYLSQVRKGLKIPHPRHWPALRSAVM